MSDSSISIPTWVLRSPGKHQERFTRIWEMREKISVLKTSLKSAPYPESYHLGSDLALTEKVLRRELGYYRKYLKDKTEGFAHEVIDALI